MTTVDLFAGIGWALGLRSLGMTEVGIDLEPSVCATRAALGLPTIRADLTTYPPRPCTGLIASPPCTDWSSAGRRAGRSGETGWLVDVVPQWVLRGRPRSVACEQVPEALEVWEEHAHTYRALGYRTWTGILCAADYGVPQTRRRAFLLAHAERQPHPPEPTHSRMGEGLFGGQPWVSMAEALGWDGEDTPARTVCGDRGPRWAYEDRDGTHGRVLTERQPHGATRQPHELSMTITASADNGNFRWQLNTHRDQRPDGSTQTRPAPAPALTAKALGQWQWERPATTVCADPRIAEPGHRDREGGEQQFERATRVTIAEGLILQGFPPDTPLAGNKSQQWAQIGNAVPPPWAAAIVGSLAA